VTFERARAVADAVLYEGLVLYPYRASAPKNRLRWQFGVLAPRAFAEAGGGEAWWMETQCLVAPTEGARIEGKLRFLQRSRRRLEVADGVGFRPTEALELGDRRLVPWDEVLVREIDFALPLGAWPSSRTQPFTVDGGLDIEVCTADGRCQGRVLRERREASGLISLEVEGERAAAPLLKLRIRVENHTPRPGPGAPRDEALGASLLGAHLLLAVAGGRFVSLYDPPAWAEEAAAGCRSVRAYPVLAGEPGSDDLVLSAPIILYDHPQIAPESPGDFFDATEIDELLTLRTLTLTDAEKREARATDSMTAALLDRVERMTPASLERLHGAIRERRPAVDAAPARRARSLSVLVGGVAIAPGSRVRLRPGARRADAQDMFLAGLTATVEAVLEDAEGRDCLAVTLDDDPSAGLLRAHGRYHYFHPEEVEPLPETEAQVNP
jgi:hypothetical protein